MLEVVFSDSAAGTMAVAIGHKGFLGGATSVIISDGTVSKEEIEKFQHQAEERERSGWENAIPLEGNRKDIVNLPLALSVGNISEAGICLERESALSLLLSILPDMASEIVTELLNTSRKNYATLLEKAQNGEPIRVWVGREPDDVCGLYWLLEQLRPIGFEKLDVKRKKKIAAAIYEYQADCDGEWGEISLDFENGTAEIIRLADWDTMKTNRFANKVIAYLLNCENEKLPTKTMLAFEP